MQGIGHTCKMQHIVCRIQDTGCSIEDRVFWVQDVGLYFVQMKDVRWRVRLTWLYRDTWKMFPSLPPQNRKYSQGSKVTDMISTSNRTDRSSSPDDNSHTWTEGQRGRQINLRHLSVTQIIFRKQDRMQIIRAYQYCIARMLHLIICRARC